MTIQFPAQREATTTLHALCSNIGELLAAFSTSPTAQVALCQFSDGRYVQFWAGSDVAIGEVVSNRFLDDDVRLSEDQERTLLDAGWTGPDEDSPNWHVVRRGERAHVAVACLTVDALTRVLGYGAAHANDEVRVKTFHSSSTSPA